LHHTAPDLAPAVRQLCRIQLNWPAAAGHGPRATRILAVRPDPALYCFPWSPFPPSAVHADGGRAEGPSRPGRTPVGLEQLRVVAAKLFALPLNRCHYCAW